MTSMRFRGAPAATAIVLVALAALTACTSSEHLAAKAPEPQPSAPAATPPAPPTELAGRWKLTAASGGACFMNFASAAGAAQGAIAPEGGCPGSFFTSRKWTFERDALIIRNHKGEPLAQLAFSGGHFEGREPNGAAVVLSR